MLTRRNFNGLLLGSGLYATGVGFVNAQAFPNFQPIEGQDYQKISVPHSASTDGKVEVTEFFMYSCPHCFSIEPVVNKWLVAQAADVKLTRIPVAFNRGTMPHARLYFTLQALKKLDEMHPQVFQDYHVKRIPMQTDDQVFTWAQKNGFDMDLFKSAYKSFAVNNAVSQAERKVRDFKITGVPSFFVNNQYSVMAQGSPKAGEPAGQARIFATIDYLVNKVRAAR